MKNIYKITEIVKNIVKHKEIFEHVEADIKDNNEKIKMYLPILCDYLENIQSCLSDLETEISFTAIIGINCDCGIKETKEILGFIHLVKKIRDANEWIEDVLNTINRKLNVILRDSVLYENAAFTSNMLYLNNTFDCDLTVDIKDLFDYLVDAMRMKKDLLFINNEIEYYKNNNNSLGLIVTKTCRYINGLKEFIENNKSFSNVITLKDSDKIITITKKEDSYILTCNSKDLEEFEKLELAVDAVKIYFGIK